MFFVREECGQIERIRRHLNLFSGLTWTVDASVTQMKAPASPLTSCAMPTQTRLITGWLYLPFLLLTAFSFPVAKRYETQVTPPQ